MELHKMNFIVFLLKLTLIIRCSHSEICWDPVCYFTLEVDRNQNLVYKDPTIGVIFEVDYVNGAWVTVESPARPAALFGNFIGMEVEPREIITTDGFRRNVFTINGQFPGPTLEVGYPSEIVVTVMNELLDEAITIHWHGQDQLGTPWMDGLAFITQCPILPRQNFTYQFRPDPPGTFWYHTHLASQMRDGIKGMLIIHERLPTLPYFMVLVSDWWHYVNHDIAATDPARGSGGQVWSFKSPRAVDGVFESIIPWTSGLFNGRGRYNQADTFLPLSTFEVTQGSTHLFRVANGAAEYNFEISVDSHALKVVALDGVEIVPVTVDAVVIPIGGGTDFEIEGNQQIGNYWVRARTLKDTQADPVLQEFKAILRYTGAADGDPTTSFRTCTATRRCSVMGCALLRYPASYYTDCIDRAQATHTYTPREREKYGLNQKYPDIEFFLNTRVDSATGQLSFNSFEFIDPTTPVFQTDSYSQLCDDCPETSTCRCTYTLSIPKDRVVQIVVTNINLDPLVPLIIAHPIHIHGQHFALLKNEFVDYKDYEAGDPNDLIASTPSPDINCTDGIICRKARWTSGEQPTDLNLNNPPLLDTNLVAPSGYFVMRFRSINPGLWLLHCHTNHHAYPFGHMKVLLDIGRFYYPPIPPKFPVCQAEFALVDQEFRHYYQDSLDAIRNGGKYQLVQVPAILRPPSPPPRPSRTPRQTSAGSVNTGEFIGWMVGSFFLGLSMACIVAILIICGCCKCQAINRRHLEPTNKIQPNFTGINYGHKLFYAIPSLKKL